MTNANIETNPISAIIGKVNNIAMKITIVITVDVKNKAFIY